MIQYIKQKISNFLLRKFIENKATYVVGNMGVFFPHNYVENPPKREPFILLKFKHKVEKENLGSSEGKEEVIIASIKKYHGTIEWVAKAQLFGDEYFVETSQGNAFQIEKLDDSMLWAHIPYREKYEKIKVSKFLSLNHNHHATHTNTSNTQPQD
ncbi:hypothetical protein [Bernardetia sp.]|uniref:hypothetical protein n=1 Tax=Bernardetia sp. TaxID=1937974 RepID=UPI0025B90475|nr:hypothetical protein [Bernardetia sp.]